jgi:hypothetical protein
MQNDKDWRYKHAAMMAFSQVGEYCEGPEDLANLIQPILDHC